MAYIDYVKMTPEQQQQVKDSLLTKSMREEDLPNWRFFVNEDGSVRRLKGRHQPTAERAAEWKRNAEDVRRSIRGEIPGDPAKGSIRHFLSGARYSFSRD